MKCVYLLQHMYFYGQNNIYEETKIIGIFDSRIKAEKTIDKYRKIKLSTLDLIIFFTFDKMCIKEV